MCARMQFFYCCFSPKKKNATCLNPKLGTEATATCVRILLHSSRPHTLVASSISYIVFILHLHQRCKYLFLRVSVYSRCIVQAHSYISIPGAYLYILHIFYLYTFIPYILPASALQILLSPHLCLFQVHIYIYLIYPMLVLSYLHQRCKSCFLRISVYSRCTAGPRSLLCKLVYE